ncbi:putative FMN binding protein [Schizothecium vesticola]|uniref:FMN binding protein n=1 Tax=Schizothecium vesticola TaxID=314040 RepID=A0AA40EG23_9PEZI|nr:putative FMN binding protein [Schizothecium vesticola]
MAAQNTANFEAKIKRNPHPDFKKVEASRPPFPASSTFHHVQTPDPNWKFGSGANHLASSTTTTPPNDSLDTPPDDSLNHPPNDTPTVPRHRPIDPHSPTRPSHLNYTLLISSILPRPICLLSTCSPSGLPNLAPFSYFQLISHDPPLFILSFASSLASPKDSLRNLSLTGDCVLNMVSETFLEAANACAVNAPPGASEWDVSGLTPVFDDGRRVARVGEAVVSVEGRVESIREFPSRARPGEVGATMVVVEGTRFWVREDAVDEAGGRVDPGVMRAVGRLGGISYGRVGEGVELPRPDWERDVGGAGGWRG